MEQPEKYPGLCGKCYTHPCRCKKSSEDVFYEIFQKKAVSSVEFKIIKAMEAYTNQFNP